MPKKTVKKATKKAVKKAIKQTESGLSFENVVHSVSRLHSEFLRQATKAVNVSLTLRCYPQIGVTASHFLQMRITGFHGLRHPPFDRSLTLAALMATVTA